jgi:Na+/phosphate symporter
MTTALLTLTLSEMQQTPACELRAAALTATCRYYAAACSQMAQAQDAYRLGDMALVRSHVERAKRAHTLSQEVEADRVKRTGRDIAERETAAAAR